jgi:hypothetical protein
LAEPIKQALRICMIESELIALAGVVASSPIAFRVRGYLFSNMHRFIWQRADRTERHR